MHGFIQFCERGPLAWLAFIIFIGRQPVPADQLDRIGP